MYVQMMFWSGFSAGFILCGRLLESFCSQIAAVIFLIFCETDDKK